MKKKQTAVRLPCSAEPKGIHEGVKGEATNEDNMVAYGGKVGHPRYRGGQRVLKSPTRRDADERKKTLAKQRQEAHTSSEFGKVNPKGGIAHAFDQVCNINWSKRFEQSSEREHEVQAKTTEIRGKIRLTHVNLLSQTIGNASCQDEVQEKRVTKETRPLATVIGAQKTHREALWEQVSRLNQDQAHFALQDLTKVITRVKSFQERLATIELHHPLESNLHSCVKALVKCFDGLSTAALLVTETNPCEIGSECLVQINHTRLCVKCEVHSKLNKNDSLRRPQVLAAIREHAICKAATKSTETASIINLDAEYDVLCAPLHNVHKARIGYLVAVISLREFPGHLARFLLLVARKVAAKMSLLLQRHCVSEPSQTSFDATQFIRLEANCSALAARQRAEPTVDLARTVENISARLQDHLPSASITAVLLLDTATNELVSESQAQDERGQNQMPPGLRMLYHEKFVAFPNNPDRNETNPTYDFLNAAPDEAFVHAPNVRKIVNCIQVRWKVEKAQSELGRCIADNVTVHSRIETEDVVARILVPGANHSPTPLSHILATPLRDVHGRPFALLVALGERTFASVEVETMEALSSKLWALVDSALHADRVFRHSLRTQVEHENHVHALQDEIGFSKQLFKHLATLPCFPDGEGLINHFALAAKGILHTNRTSFWLKKDVVHLLDLGRGPESLRKEHDGLVLCTLERNTAPLKRPMQVGLHEEISLLEVPLVSRSGAYLGVLQTFVPLPRRRRNSLDDAARENLVFWVVRTIRCSQLFSQLIEKACVSAQHAQLVAHASVSSSLIKTSLLDQLALSEDVTEALARFFPNDKARVSTIPFCMRILRLSKSLLRASSCSVCLFDNTVSTTDYWSVIHDGDVHGQVQVFDAINHCALLGATTLFEHARYIDPFQIERYHGANEPDQASELGSREDNSEEELTHQHRRMTRFEPTSQRAFSRNLVRKYRCKFDEDDDDDSTIKCSAFTDQTTSVIADLLLESERRPMTAQNGFANRTMLQTGLFRNAIAELDDQSSIGESLSSSDESDCQDKELEDGGFRLVEHSALDTTCADCIVSAIEHNVTGIRNSVSIQMQQAQIECEKAATARRFWAPSAGLIAAFHKRKATAGKHGSSLGLEEAWRMVVQNYLPPSAFNAKVELERERAFLQSLTGYTKVEMLFSEAMAAICSVSLLNEYKLSELHNLVTRAGLVKDILLAMMENSMDVASKLKVVSLHVRRYLLCDRITVFRVLAERGVAVPVFQSSCALENLDEQGRFPPFRSAHHDEEVSTHISRGIVSFSSGSHVAHCAKSNAPVVQSCLLGADSHPLMEQSANGSKYEIFSQLCVPLFDKQRTKVIGVLQACNKFSVKQGDEHQRGCRPRFVSRERNDFAIEAFSVDDLPSIQETGIIAALGDLVKRCDLKSTNPSALEAMRSGVVEFLFESMHKSFTISKAKENLLNVRRRAMERLQQKRLSASSVTIPDEKQTSFAREKSNMSLQADEESKADLGVLLRQGTQRLEEDEILRKERDDFHSENRDMEDKSWAEEFVIEGLSTKQSKREVERDHSNDSDDGPKDSPPR